MCGQKRSDRRKLYCDVYNINNSGPLLICSSTAYAM